MFLFCLLTPAETRYWPTKLEMVGLFQVLWKTRHLVETIKTLTIVYTNHGASLGITKATTLSISSMNKLNLWLICTSDYIQCFSLVIKYKLGKYYISSDTLSRLEVKEKDLLENKRKSKLDMLCITTLIEMSKKL